MNAFFRTLFGDFVKTMLESTRATSAAVHDVPHTVDVAPFGDVHDPRTEQSNWPGPGTSQSGHMEATLLGHLKAWSSILCCALWPC